MGYPVCMVFCLKTITGLGYYSIQLHYCPGPVVREKLSLTQSAVNCQQFGETLWEQRRRDRRREGEERATHQPLCATQLIPAGGADEGRRREWAVNDGCHSTSGSPPLSPSLHSLMA